MFLCCTISAIKRHEHRIVKCRVYSSIHVNIFEIRIYTNKKRPPNQKKTKKKKKEKLLV
jgi:hypothetical protein